MTKLLAATTLVVGLCGGLYYFNNFGSGDERTPQSEAVVEQPVIPVEQRYPYVMPAKSTLSAELSKLQISSRDIHDLVIAAKPHWDLARIAPGTRYQVLRSADLDNSVAGIRFRFSPQDVLALHKTQDGWFAEKIEKPVTTKVVTFMGTVRTSLWDSAVAAEMDPSLIAELAEIFAWQVDFAREVQVNDRWRLSVEQEYVGTEVVGLGTILSAEYINNGTTHTAVLYRKDGEKLGYYAPDGSSLRRMFLKSPIQYARISSRFQKARFHPVLKTARPHLGVDYAAPIGTPIRAVGDGIVTFAAWSGGGGNVIKLRHNSTYDTAYKHLSRFAKGIRPGTRVTQGQTIGYVGSTGLSTGPHLHFEFFVNGKFMDPLRYKFPGASPIPSSSLAEFLENKNTLLAHLPEWALDEASVNSLVR